MDIREPEINHEDILILNDNHFNTDNVCIVTGSGTGIGRATAIAAAANAVMLGGGYFNPLTGYMNVADAMSVGVLLPLVGKQLFHGE